MAFNARSANHIGESKYSVVGNTENGITARAGGGQASAYLLRAQLSVIETAANAGDSVKLPRISTTPNLLGSLNSLMIVSNTTAHAVQVFGSSPDKIDGAATGTGVSLPAGQSATFFVANFTTPFDQSAGTGEWVSTIVAGGGGGSIAIGDPVGGGDPNVVLFLDASGNLAQDAGLTFTNANGVIFGDPNFVASASQLYATGVYSQDAFGNAISWDASNGGMLISGKTVSPNVLFYDVDSGNAFNILLDGVGVANTLTIYNDANAAVATFAQDQSVTLPSLAGTGNRGTFADASGLLSAPAVLSYDANHNYIFGEGAGATVTSGADGIFIGRGADGGAASNNQIAIGQGVVTSGDNQMKLGNSSVSDIHFAGIGRWRDNGGLTTFSHDAAASSNAVLQVNTDQSTLSLNVKKGAGAYCYIEFDPNSDACSFGNVDGTHFGLYINGNTVYEFDKATGQITVTSLAGTGERVVSASSAGVLAASASFSLVDVAATLAAFTMTMGTQSVSLGAINAGDAAAAFNDSNGSYIIGADTSANNFALAHSGTLGTNNVFTSDGTTFEVVNVLKINNTLQADAGAVSTHTVNINVGGTVYKFLVKT